jgi:hypothetical protein
MKTLKAIPSIASLLLASSALAQVQGTDLNGQYRCVQLCRGDSLAAVTQNGWELNIVNEAGEPSRAWINYPGRAWIDRAQQGAIYTIDGMNIQFDGGTRWERYIEPPFETIVIPRRRR